jgi:hypothetical protein
LHNSISKRYITNSIKAYTITILGGNLFHFQHFISRSRKTRKNWAVGPSLAWSLWGHAFLSRRISSFLLWGQPHPFSGMETYICGSCY